MARVRKSGSIENDIAKQEEAVAKAKERYDTLVAKPIGGHAFTELSIGSYTI